MPKVDKARTTASRTDPIARPATSQERLSPNEDDPSDLSNLYFAAAMAAVIATEPGLQLNLEEGDDDDDSLNDAEGVSEESEDDSDAGGVESSEDDGPSGSGSSVSDAEDEDESVSEDESVVERDSAVNAARPDTFGSLRHTFARPDQEQIGYLFRVMLQTLSAPNIVRVLRTAFEWSNSHLYKFDLSIVQKTGDKRKRHYDSYGIPFDPSEIMKLEEQVDHYREILSETECEKLKSSRDIKLWQIFENAEWSAKGIVTEYTYDFGDNWDHILHFMGRAGGMLGEAMGKLDQQAAFCIAGEGRVCDEHSGGYPKTNVWSWSIEKVNKDLKKLCRLNNYTR